jgi:hypothetical protein
MGFLLERQAPQFPARTGLRPYRYFADRETEII